MLLQAAHEAFRLVMDDDAIVLTYNVALAADITRLIALLRIPGASEGGGVEVKTVMSFVYAWLKPTGTWRRKRPRKTSMPTSASALPPLNGSTRGTVTAADIAKAKDANQSLLDFRRPFSWTRGRDWPQAEADLLTRLYDPSTILVADGLDQLVRGERTNWHTAAGGRDKGLREELGSLPANEAKTSVYLRTRWQQQRAITGRSSRATRPREARSSWHASLTLRSAT